MGITDRAWHQLAFLNYYRLGLAGLFVALCVAGEPPAPLGEHHPGLFTAVSIAYAVACALAVIAFHLRRPAFPLQVYLFILVDISAITLLMHASGGVRSGLGMLLIITVAGGSLLMEGRTARLFAAIAALAVLLEQAYAWLAVTPPATGYTHAGLLGASFFATAILAHGLAQRLRESEALAEKRGVDLANMAQLTEYVIQRMQTGIVVVDSDFDIRLINASAARLLEFPAGAEGRSIDRVSPGLGKQLRDWWSDAIPEPGVFHASDTGAELLPRFARLGADKNAGTLIFLEDTAAMAQQAQQLKLASLGRLTAGIAHEVRNPLGAISHASQLLAESPHLDTGDFRLTEIIQQHSERVNGIIENIMQLSRGQRARPETLTLKPWLDHFIDDFRNNEAPGACAIRLEIEPGDLQVQMDPGQLRQILSNLCQNACRHGGPELCLKAGVHDDSGAPYLDVVDNGPGIDDDVAQQIFEPFFTTSPNGTGMGLYISRELCMGNQARLNYLRNPGGGSRFRITFADSRRRQVA
jgi:two-component system, NtrC family, sensor histidine kinase PilS